MKRFSVVIVGRTPCTEKLARELCSPKTSVALISLAHTPETAQFNEQKSLGLSGFFPETPALELSSEITLFTGSCRFETKHKLHVGDQTIEGDRFVLSMGSVPESIPASVSAFDLMARPKSPTTATIVGSGGAAAGLALKLAQKGCRVTLVGRGERLLPSHDQTLSQWIKEQMDAADVQVHLGEAYPTEFSAENLVVAADWSPNTAGFDLEKAGVFVNKSKQIVTNDEMRTSAPHVWALGPVTDKKWTPSFELHQAELIATNIDAPMFGKKRYLPGPLARLIPSAPPAASIGQTESEARATYKDVLTESVRLNDNCALKLIARRRNGALLGAHMVGDGAEQLMIFFHTVMEVEISLYDLEDAHYFPFHRSTTLARDAVRTWIKSAQSHS